jgi:hypothetical protein
MRLRLTQRRKDGAMFDLDISSHADTIVAILLACVIVVVVLV